jgi:hypothetical protein
MSRKNLNIKKMDSTIKELIESATVNGTISEEERNYIIKKASEIGIDEIEVNIFIKANLQKNSLKLNPNDTNTTNKNFTENNWLKFNEFKLGNWIIIIGIILIFISGFLPWVTSRVSSSGFGQSYGGSGSIGGGFFYTLPLAIAAFLFAMKRNLNHLRIYFGPFVMVVAIGLVASYANSAGSSGFGFSASASSSAGPGVALLFISGLIYLIGCIVLLDKSNKIRTVLIQIRTVLIHEYAILAYFFCLIIIPIPFDNFRLKFWPSIFVSLFCAGLPLLLANYKGYLKTKSVLIGNLAFWLLIIILPRYPESSILHYARATFDSISFYYLYLFTTICLAALISDFLQSKGKNIEIINKLKVLFKPILLVLAIMIPFICLTLFSTITKHKVTYEELETFTQKNTDYKGYWYFLNSDSTKVNSLIITSQSNISSDESGDINLLLTAYFDVENTIKLNKYEAELKLKEDYSFEIKYPIVFENMFEIKSYENNILNGVLTTSSGEKVAITAARESDGFEEVIRKKQESIELLTNQVEFNNTIDQGTFTIISDKCYFYSEPSIENQRNAYLVKGQSGSFNQVVNGFVFVSYTNADGITTEGWLNTSDIEIN